MESRVGKRFFPSLLYYCALNNLFLLIDIAIRKCYNACEKSLEIV